MMVASAAKTTMSEAQSPVGAATYWSSFASAFLLTISSPLTIVFWTSLFSSKAIEKGYSKKELVPFGFAAGLATLTFLGLAVTVLSTVRASIPVTVIQVLNGLVGALLILYGVVRLWKTWRQPQEGDERGV
jgi:threonine/homoserine/homoserine lactone efflux protein